MALRIAIHKCQIWTIAKKLIHPQIYIISTLPRVSENFLTGMDSAMYPGMYAKYP